MAFTSMEMFKMSESTKNDAFCRVAQMGIGCARFASVDWTLASLG
jgi:hypothetical protein